jgi:pSer/pThr/pTyr-binding forkhead associated (FHA) protein
MGNSQQSNSDVTKADSSKSKCKSELLIKSLTWSRDSHGLYDYEGKNFTKKNIKTHRSGVLTRNGDDVHLVKENGKSGASENKELFKFFTKDGSFWITSTQDIENNKKTKDGAILDENSEGYDNGVWIVVKSIKPNNNKGYPLSEGDLIKLGRIKFRVKEVQGSPTALAQKPMKTEANNEHDQSIDASMTSSRASVRNLSNSAAQTCRICLSESAEPGNPFFSPCVCSGTMKYVHIKCLQRWLKSKLHVKDSGQSISIYWKTLECELCKSAYPNSFQIKDQRYDVVEFERPNCAYMMLEMLNKETNIPRGIHIIKMENKNNIRLGRGHDSDIRITDISVSRCHAFIKLDKGKFYLEDNTSKFGTLVNMRRPFRVSDMYNNISLQSGRTLVTVTVKKSKSYLPVCWGQSKNMDSSDDEANSDGEDRIETEHNIPSRNSHLPTSNRNSNIPAAPSGDHFDDDNIYIENLEDVNPQGQERQVQDNVDVNVENERNE